MSDWFNMGGYELYVWGSMGFALAVYAWNLLAPALQRKDVLARLSDPDADEDAGENA